MSNILFVFYPSRSPLFLSVRARTVSIIIPDRYIIKRRTGVCATSFDPIRPRKEGRSKQTAWVSNSPEWFSVPPPLPFTKSSVVVSLLRLVRATYEFVVSPITVSVRRSRRVIPTVPASENGDSPTAAVVVYDVLVLCIMNNAVAADVCRWNGAFTKNKKYKVKNLHRSVSLFIIYNITYYKCVCVCVRAHTVATFCLSNR